jgi:uncharacterized protein (TIGR02302 family)
MRYWQTLKPEQRLDIKRRIAFCILLFERFSLASWRVITWTFAYFGLCLLQIPALLGGWAVVTALIIYWVGAFYLIYKDGKNFKIPTPSQTDRALENTSGFTYRPLEILEDKIANDSVEAQRLWAVEERKSLSLLNLLKIPKPTPHMARLDPYGLRLLSGIFFIMTLIIAGQQGPQHLMSNLFPLSFSDPKTGAAFLNLTLIPPEYTKLPRVAVMGSGRLDEPLTAVEGSKLELTVNTVLGKPTLRIDRDKFPFEKLTNKSWSLHTILTEGKKLSVNQWGISRASLPLSIIKDQPPTLTVSEEVQQRDKSHLQFALDVKDDFGVSEIIMEMTLDPLVDTPHTGSPYTEQRLVMTEGDKETRLSPVYDLTWHAWSGLPVIIRFSVKDAIGQTAQSEPLKVVLPEREFKNPVAAQLIAMRKEFMFDRENVDFMARAEEILNILVRPSMYRHDKVVFLNLRSMISRLVYSPDNKTLDALAVQLWNTAVHVEDGKLPEAARDLRNAKAHLDRLLADKDSTDAEIQQAMQDLRSAMQSYYESLYQEIQKRLANGEILSISQELLESLMNHEDMAAYLDQLQQAALSNERQTAREMLSQLQSLMDQLEPDMHAEMPKDMKAMQKTMEDLQGLIEEQKALLNRSKQLEQQMNPQSSQEQSPPQDPFDLGEMNEQDQAPENMDDGSGLDNPDGEGGGGGNEPLTMKGGQKIQGGIRMKLGDTMTRTSEQINDIPPSMQKAEGQMRASEKAMQDGNIKQSIASQEKALDDLQSSMDEMGQSMAERMQQMMSNQAGQPTDPLGRAQNSGNGPSWMPNNNIKIPDQADRKRVQDIQKTLRDRSGQMDRPMYELEYYRRLLKQF